MPLRNAAQQSVMRFNEVQNFLSSIKANEPPVGTPIPLELNINKGLVFVILYGAFEYSTTRLFVDMSALINSTSVQHCHVDDALHAYSLDPLLTSVRMSGKTRKWSSRADVFNKQKSTDAVVLNESCFLQDLSNVWAETVVQLFKVLGVPGVALYNAKVRQYIDMVVDRRNAVAHGRESPAVVGQGYTGADLQNLLDELSKQVQYMNSQFAAHLQSRSFIKSAHRSQYP